jgi:hypothetical protein
VLIIPIDANDGLLSYDCLDLKMGINGLDEHNTSIFRAQVRSAVEQMVYTGLGEESG